ncbi:low-specificity L-threonine aldolase [Alicyclobacillus tolerans]|uniref:low-specificity L-threonine aldolase n=1 Tax=Alicyclobacillus tolerans TaxID=90970 RepID=UPI0023515EB9|nr:low-specificity L-threonine aldolase [Alicyclobacillus tolerans]MCF8563286.1 low-specificity L-threonine aldolase [Alicyclobacillus tolerans]
MNPRIDLRSDTVTKPTAEMRRAMASAEVGDDVYGEDPTVRRLEERTAEMLGKEAGLLVTSGTQGNQVAVATHVLSGQEVITEAQAHIFYYEAAAVAAIAGAQIRPVQGRKGVLDAESVREAIRPVDVHQPKTALVSIENTHNRAGGTVTSANVLRAISEAAHQRKVLVHIDGARLFNAAVALNTPARELAGPADSVQVCLSKGLCAPVGSVLVGSKAFIEEARQWRKRLGGGMRQAGVIAAPGIVALTTMVDRLAEDHENARFLAQELGNLPGIGIDLETVQTNIVIADVAGTGLNAEQMCKRLAESGVLASAFGATLVRFVTHHDVNREDLIEAVNAASKIVQAVRVS